MDSPGLAESDAAAATDLLDEYDLDESSSIDDGTLPPDRYLDRELSWLAFNQRVLELAEDDHLPLLPLEPLAQALTAGDSLVIFPEGTRSNKDQPQAFKAGLYHLAERFPEAQLIPTWIDNVQRVMPKGEVVPVPVLCSVTFGAPLQLAPGEDKHAFLDRARAAVIALREVAA